MQHLEQYFGVPLFTRGKNRIELNETGKLAVAAARKLLQEAELAVAQVRAFDQRQRTIVIRACAPAPLWELLRKLNAAQPEKMLASAVCQNEDVLAAWEDGSCDVAVLPFPFAGAKPFLQEQLFVCVPPEHALAKQASLTFAEINGFNFLLRSELGFWDTLCREKMPASKFLVQTDTAVFDERLVSPLLHHGLRPAPPPDRVSRPGQYSTDGRGGQRDLFPRFPVQNARALTGFPVFPSARFPYTGLTGFRNPDLARCSVSSDSSYAS